MSRHPAGTPEHQPSGEEPRRRRLNRVQFSLGAIVGAILLYVVYSIMGMDAVFAQFQPPYEYKALGAAGAAPALVYMLFAAAFTVGDRTRDLGTGMLLGGGIWLLFGGGPCLAQLVFGPL